MAYARENLKCCAREYPLSWELRSANLLSGENRQMSNSHMSNVPSRARSNAMAYAADHDHFATYPPLERDAAAGRRGILRRVVAAIHKSRQRRADLEIGRFIARSGGRLTDDN